MYFIFPHTPSGTITSLQGILVSGPSMTTRKILPIEDIHGSFSSNASFTLVRGEGFEVWQKVTSGMFDV